MDPQAELMKEDEHEWDAHRDLSVCCAAVSKIIGND